MGTTVARKEQAKLAHSLTSKLPLKEESIVSLLNLLKCLNEDMKLDRSQFREVLHTRFNMVDDILMDRVFKAFDKDNDSYINPAEWVTGICLFLNSNDTDKVKYCFKCYDLNSDGYISREEMIQLLKNSIVKQTTDEDADEGVKDLVDITLKKMDDDKDGRLSFPDFKKAVEAEPLLLEAFGMCLPSEETRKAFLMKYCPCEPEAEKEAALQHKLAVQQMEQEAKERSKAAP